MRGVPIRFISEILGVIQLNILLILLDTSSVVSSLLLHIGAPKTGTTFLQDQVMNRIQGTKCLVKPEVSVGGESVRFATLFRFSPEVWGGPNSGIFYNLVRGLAGKNDRDLLISDEGIFGGIPCPQPWITHSKERVGAYIRIEPHANNFPPLSSVTSHLEKLADLCPYVGFESLKILFTVRRQDTKLASGYAQISDRIRGASQENFEQWVRYITRHPLGYRAGGVKLDYFNYWKKLADTLGRENVFLRPFELLKENTAEFLKQWLGYLDVYWDSQMLESVLIDGTSWNKRSSSESTWTLSSPIGTGPSLPGKRMLTALNLPTRLPLRWPDFSREQEIRLSAGLSEQILEVYRHSNRSLDDHLTHLELERYGYY